MSIKININVCFICKQTKAVQKAMDEKNFELAVQLRGRYMVCFHPCL